MNLTVRLPGVRVICAVGGLALLAMACGGTPGSSGNSQSPIQVGVIVPQTGPNAADGQYELNGLKLAADAINASGGINGQKLDFTTADNRSTNDGTVAAFNRLTSGGKLDAIIGPSVSSWTSAIGPNIQREAVPFFYGGTLPSLTHQGIKEIFRERSSDQYSAKAMADYGVKTLHLTKWAILHATDQFGIAAQKYLADDLKQDGATVVADLSYQSNASDFTSTVLAIKRSGATGLATYITSAEDNGIFATQLRQLGVNNDSIRWVGSPGSAAAQSLKLGGVALDGVYAVTDYLASSSPQAQAFASKYQQTYQVPADVNAAYAYDAIGLLAAAIKKVGSADPKSILTGLHELKDYKGVVGTYTFDQYGDGVRSESVVEIRNGQLNFVTAVKLPDLPYQGV